ncbi:MAG: hypothetical protein CMM44_01035 [Rhodospirillaceae bacterium]|nr:hypothetical protein [Rhodospirillaceae bacterium]
MTTMITGAGLIGTSYAKHALRRGQKVVFVDPICHEEYLKRQLGRTENYVFLNEDVRSLTGIIKIIKDYKVDSLLHTASVIGKKAGDRIDYGYDLNVGGTLSIANAVRLTGIQRVVHISTFGAYDWRKIKTGPVKEDNFLGSGAPYSNSKVAQEKIWEAFAINADFKVVMLRLANTFGVGHFWSGSEGGKKFQDLLLAGIKGETAKIPEEQTMDFSYVYSKDVGRAIDQAMLADSPKEIVFNIGYEVIHSFNDLVLGAQKHLPNLKVEIVPGTKPVNRALPLDCSRARKVLDWLPEYNFDEAIEDYVYDLRKFVK